MLRKWMKAFESKGLNVDLGNTKVMLSVGITKDGLSNNKIYQCGICSLRVKANSVLHVQCGEYVHSGCAGLKMVTATILGNFACKKCEENPSGNGA